MTKADLIDEVSRLAELTRKDSEVIVETIFDSVVRSLRAGDKIEILGQQFTVIGIAASQQRVRLLHTQAITALTPFGERAESLRALAHWLLSRQY